MSDPVKNVVVVPQGVNALYISTDDVDKAISVTKALLDLGQFAFTKTPLSMGIFGAVGGLIQVILSFSQEEKDPVMEKLGELEKQIDRLADQMNAKFDDLKAFITEFNFFVEIINPTSVLMKLTKDVMRHPAKESIDNFRRAYEKHPPIELAYSVISLLEQKTTNPLKMALDADRLKNKVVFDKWFNIIDGVLGEFLFLEAFASGLINEKNPFNSERLTEQSQKLIDTINKWKDEYLKDESYWPELEKWLREYLEKHRNLNNSEKADEIQKVLDSILTNDAFYLMIFNRFPHPDHYSTYEAVSKQLMTLYDVGSCHTIVYRSKTANSVDISELVKMEKEVDSIKTLYAANSNVAINLANNPIFNAGFICMIGQQDEAIRSANCPRREWGPGWWKTANVKGRSDTRKVLAGYL